MKYIYELAAVAMLVGLSHQETSTVCLNCKKIDSVSSIMYSYSYCKDTDECLQDEWNYINKWCTTNWIPGWMLDIDTDCEAQEVIGQCPPFVSMDGIVTTTT